MEAAVVHRGLTILFIYEGITAQNKDNSNEIGLTSTLVSLGRVDKCHKSSASATSGDNFSVMQTFFAHKSI